jgi:agmatinase
VPKDPAIHDEFSAGDLSITRPSDYGTIGEATFAGILSFMRRRYTKDLTDVDLAVVGFPFDLATTSRPGARHGPRGVRAASAMLAWDHAWGWPFDPFDRIRVVDYGDCQFDPGRPDKIPEEVEAQFAEILATGAATLMLGGDHFATYPVLRAHHAVHGPLALIHFDAHSDTWRDEEGRIDHGTMFFHAAQQGLIDVEHSVQVGIRTTNKETHGFQILNGDWVRANGPDATIAAIRERVGDTPCYVTFDIDCLDPAFAPGTGTPVVGGLNTGDARKILRGLAGVDVRGMDLVEVAPAYDVSEITALAGASLALDLVSLFAARFPDRT